MTRKRGQTRARRAGRARPVSFFAPARDWIRLGAEEPAIRRTVERFAREEFVDRVWRKDPFAWKSDEKHRAVIENALGWLDAPGEMQRRERELVDWAHHARQGRRHVVL